MITITLHSQNFNVKDLFALKKLVQAYPDFTQQIMEQAFASEENYNLLVEASSDLPFIKTFAAEHLTPLYNIITTSPELLETYSSHLLDLENFVKTFPKKETEIHQLTIENTKFFVQLIQSTNNTLFLIKEINRLFPKSHKKTLEIFSCNEDLLKSLVAQGEKNDLVLTRLVQLISFFPNHKEELYSLLLNKFTFTAEVIAGLVKLSPDLETELYAYLLNYPASFSMVVQDDEDYETLKKAFISHGLLFSFSYKIIKNILDQKIELITEIQTKYNATKPAQDLIDVIPALKGFINKILVDLRKDEGHEFKILIKSLVTLKVAMTKHEPQKSDLVSLCLHAMKKNSHSASYELSKLPLELIERCEDMGIETSVTESSNINPGSLQ